MQAPEDILDKLDLADDLARYNSDFEQRRAATLALIDIARSLRMLTVPQRHEGLHR